MCCDNGSSSNFDVALTDFPFKTTCIGLRWKDFCVKNNFQPGESICFKFDTVNPNNFCRVYRVEIN
jgi:hypothetical protein